MQTILEEIIAKCTRCKACQWDCTFLRKYGTPGELAQSYNHDDKSCQSLPFECSLAGTRSGATLNIYDHLKNYIPSLGIVLDCCLKISHDLGREDHFQSMFREMKDFLVQSGVQKVIVACPNCHRIFSQYGEGLAVSTIYEIMDEHSLPVTERVEGTVTIHDLCPLRFSPAVHASVRSLVAKLGLAIEEMPHHGDSTVCCGEGGFVACLSSDLVAQWKGIRKDEAAGRRMITYCAGCTNHLDGISPTSHIVDLLWEPLAFRLTGAAQYLRRRFANG